MECGGFLSGCRGKRKTGPSRGQGGNDSMLFRIPSHGVDIVTKSESGAVRKISVQRKRRQDDLGRLLGIEFCDSCGAV